MKRTRAEARAGDRRMTPTRADGGREARDGSAA